MPGIRLVLSEHGSTNLDEAIKQVSLDIRSRRRRTQIHTLRVVSLGVRYHLDHPLHGKLSGRDPHVCCRSLPPAATGLSLAFMSLVPYPSAPGILHRRRCVPIHDLVPPHHAFWQRDALRPCGIRGLHRAGLYLESRGAGGWSRLYLPARSRNLR